ncbi:MAG: DUF2085 domain-containing protein [Anaerolineales bacterium]|nr:DUF2085 domain-containing protein [Anaerolineales bacterium]
MNKSASVAVSPKTGRNWFFYFVLIYGIWVWTPFLAPLLMRLGWESPAKGIYTVYSFFCHQLPERSYFFFGPRISYSLAEIQAVWVNTSNPLVLRKFIGTPEMGWKVAWSDRMISFYGGLWLFGILWYALRHRIRSLHPFKMGLLLIPITVDGLSHMVSDLAGIGLGFRDSNLWLANLTNFAFAPDFYAGDALGSFNSWMRIITGLLAGLALVWFAFPYIDLAYSPPARRRLSR